MRWFKVVNVFKMLAEKKQKIREEHYKKAKKNLSMAKDIAKQKKAIAKEKAEIRRLKIEAKRVRGPSNLDKGLSGFKKLGNQIRENQARNTGVFGGSTRNIHEGTGRNIWYDKPVQKRARTKSKGKKLVIQFE